MQTNFQAGVDTIYNAVVDAGATPASKSPSDIATSIGSTGIKKTLVSQMRRNFSVNDNTKFSNASSFNIKSINANYASLTVNNFLLRVIKVAGIGYSNSGAVINDIMSYNSSTGILTIQDSYMCAYSESNMGISDCYHIIDYDVYMVCGTDKNNYTLTSVTLADHGTAHISTLTKPNIIFISCPQSTKYNGATTYINGVLSTGATGAGNIEIQNITDTGFDVYNNIEITATIQILYV